MSAKKKSEFSKYPTQDKAILIVGYILLGLFCIAIILPMIYIILASFIDPVTLQNKGLTFDFSKWTLTAYERVMSNGQIWVGFKNALIYSILFTIISGVITLLAAYPMSRPDFKGKGFFNTLTATGDHSTLEHLNTLGVAFDDLDGNLDRIANVKFVAFRLDLLIANFVKYVHFNLFSVICKNVFHKSGRRLRVSSSAFSLYSLPFISCILPS
jgi:hypothetical protein